MRLSFVAALLVACSASHTPGDGGAEDGGNTANGPAAPTALTMTSQGLDSVSLSWVASAGADHYAIYRNGTKYDTATGTTYTDAKAPNANAPTVNHDGPTQAGTTYGYAVSAIDAGGHEGPQATQMTAWVYHDGAYQWSGDYNFGTLTSDYKDTMGAPEDGPYDIRIDCNGGGWQPYSGSPFLVPSGSDWTMEIGAFHYMTIDLKPTKANQVWQLNIISRAPTGDLFNTGAVKLPGTFGPAPVVGQWATYKVPFLVDGSSADGVSLEVGTGQFVGSIDGEKLTVTKMISGLNVQGASWLTGTGVLPGTYVSGPASGDGGPGSEYTVVPSQTVASTTLTAQRTNMYKFSLIDETNAGQNTFYVDRVGFTTE